MAMTDRVKAIVACFRTGRLACKVSPGRAMGGGDGG